jgi:hypothetical protein
MAGPIRYWNNMNSPVIMIEYIRFSWMMNIIAAKNAAKMKATRNIEDPIANFNWPSLAMLSPYSLMTRKDWFKVF